MSKAKLVNILDAARALGWNPKGKLGTKLRIEAAIAYLSQYKLTQVELDPAYIDAPTKTPLPFAIKQSELNKLVKNNSSSDV